MKKMKIILKTWGLLPMVVVALALTACSSEDNTIDTPQTDEPVENGVVNTIAYSVTVNGSEAATRATVDADNKTLRFAAGDKLYIASDSRTDLKGTLTLKAGDEGKTSGVTFEGSLTYTGDAPDNNIVLKATLVGSSNVGVTITDGKVTGITYPTTSFCTSVNDAVEKYSNLTGTGTYAARSFLLTQQTAFLNFTLTLNDGTATATDITATVKNGETTLSTATVTTSTEDTKVVAKFVLPVASGNTLSGAKNASKFDKWSTNTTTHEFDESEWTRGDDALKRTTHVSGYTYTTTLAEKENAATNYPAAYRAKNYTTLPAPATGTTCWFLPSAQQWVRIQTGLGGLDESVITYSTGYDTGHTAATAWDTAMTKAGSGKYDSMSTKDYTYNQTDGSNPRFWSSSEGNDNTAAVGFEIYLTESTWGFGFKWGGFAKDSGAGPMLVRPVLAF